MAGWEDGDAPETAETGLGESHETAISDTEIGEALDGVQTTLDEVRPEVAERLGEADVQTWLGELRDTLQPHAGQIESARVASAALACVETVLALKDGTRALDAESAVQLIAFALQVYEYIDKEHYLGDLERAAEQLEPLLKRMEATNKSGG